jgi:hypothetical protein
MHSMPYMTTIRTALTGAVLLAEEAIAAEQREIVIDRLAVLRSIAEEASTDPEEQMHQRAVRIRMCASLMSLASGQICFGKCTSANRGGSLPGCTPAGGGSALYPVTAQVRSTTTWKPSTAQAQRRFSTRPPTGCTPCARCATCMASHHPNDEHSLAQALRPQSRPSSLRGSQHTGELALSAMLDETTPKVALQRCERFAALGLGRTNTRMLAMREDATPRRGAA